MDEIRELKPLDLIGKKKVIVEGGVGHGPGVAVTDRLENIDGIIEGKVILVSFDEKGENLKHVSHGSVAPMTMAQFAESSFLEGKVSTMYFFNVFGEEPFMKLHESRLNELFQGLVRKLKPGGAILIGEHASSEKAVALRDVKQYENLGCSVELFTSSIAIDAVLTKQYGFSQRYAKAFVGQSEENKIRKGKDASGFLLILKKR